MLELALILTPLAGLLGLIVGLTDTRTGPTIQRVLKWLGVLFGVGLMLVAAGLMVSQVLTLAFGLLALGLLLAGLSLLLIPIVGLVVGIVLLAWALRGEHDQPHGLAAKRQSLGRQQYPQPIGPPTGMLPTAASVQHGEPVPPRWKERDQRHEPKAAGDNAWLGGWAPVAAALSPTPVQRQETAQHVKAPAVAGAATGPSLAPRAVDAKREAETRHHVPARHTRAHGRAHRH